MNPSDLPPGSGKTARPGVGAPLQFRALPLRILVVGRFGLERNKFHRLDASGVAGLLERTGPALSFRAADLLRADGTELSIQLTFRHRRDFKPAAVARAVPELKRVLAARNAPRPGSTVDGFRDLAAVHRALTDAPAAQEQASATSAEPVQSGRDGADSSGDDSIDRLLDMVDGPSASPGTTQETPDDPARRALSGFISEVSRGSKRPTPSASIAPEGLEAILTAQIAAVLDHPDFRCLERSWTALRFLARRIDQQARITIDILESEIDSVADALEATVPEDDLDAAGPVRLVVDLNDYDASDRDIARLRRLADFGASRRAVVLANAGSDFAGEAESGSLAAMHDPETRFADDRFTAWRSLRDASNAVWLGLCLSRIALRDAHDDLPGRTSPANGARRIGQPLDVGVAPAVATLLAAAAAQRGWPCVGRTTDQIVDNLVIVDSTVDDLEGPVRPALSVNAADSVANAGLITLVAERGRDQARLLRMPSVRKARDRESAFETALPTVLFQSQVVHGLQWNADRLFSAGRSTDLRERVEAYLGSLIGETGPGSSAEVRLDSDDDGQPVLAIVVRSGADVAPGASMHFDIPITGDDDGG
ncbi:type VI secretion system contractile sheath large subunit [Thalassobaculum sp.]|uniref:type VI secretion system contractile sheath domain-containing protein n=1 Tax=Thalassobaculum sp. TaxID=2022740 RepID=UPI0032EE6FED